MSQESLDYEGELITAYLRPLIQQGKGRENPARNLLDDVAHLPPLPSNRKWIMTTDAALPGLHFPTNCSADVAVRRAIRRNLSDLLAGGAQPAFWLLSLTIPSGASKTWVKDWLQQFYRCAQEEQEKFHFHLLGGDLTLANYDLAQPSLSITMIGSAPLSADMQRKSARPGDICCLSGSIGDAALGYHLKNLRKPDVISREQLDTCYHAYTHPSLPTNLSHRLAKLKRCAAIDISDGLWLDASRLADASSLGIVIDFNKIPMSSTVRHWTEYEKNLTIPLACGDDYALFFAISKQDFKSLKQEIAAQALSAEVYPIGECVDSQKGVQIKLPPTYRLPLKKGFVHGEA